MNRPDPRRSWRRAVFGIDVSLYALALATPVVDYSAFSGEEHSILGFGALLMTVGWPEILCNLGNVALWVGWFAYLSRQPLAALVCGALALTGAALAPRVTGTAMADLQVGYHLWLATMAFIFLAAFLELVTELRNVDAEPIESK